MELREASKILSAVKTALAADGIKLTSGAETEGLMILLDRTDCNKLIATKIKHAKSLMPGTPAYIKAFGQFAFYRALAVAKTGISDPVTSVSLMMLHKTLCGDLDPEAGRPRNREALTNGNAHTDCKYVQGSLKAILTKMNELGCAPEIGKEDFAGYLTHYMRELIIMHPFDNGSEFTVRMFIMLFCKLKGFALCYNRVPPSAISAAELEAFVNDDVTPLYKMFLTCLSYERTTVTARAARPQQKPRTRREIDKATGSPASPKIEAPDNIEEVRMRADELDRKQSENLDEVRLRRILKIQQKIAKLNELLEELTSQQNNK